MAINRFNAVGIVRDPSAPPGGAVDFTLDCPHLDGRTGEQSPCELPCRVSDRSAGAAGKLLASGRTVRVTGHLTTDAAGTVSVAVEEWQMMDPKPQT